MDILNALMKFAALCFFAPEKTALAGSGRKILESAFRFGACLVNTFYVGSMARESPLQLLKVYLPRADKFRWYHGVYFTSSYFGRGYFLF